MADKDEASGGKPRDPDKIAEEAEVTREHIDQMIAELDRRRHAATDLPRQLGKHPVIVIAGAALTVGVLVGVALFGARRRRRRQALPGRMARLNRALRRMAEHPERVTHRNPSIVKKVVIAAVTSAVFTAAKRLVTAQFRDAAKA